MVDTTKLTQADINMFVRVTNTEFRPPHRTQLFSKFMNSVVQDPALVANWLTALFQQLILDWERGELAQNLIGDWGHVVAECKKIQVATVFDD